MTNRQLLDRSGERIITFVRDDAVRQYEQLETGQLKPAEDQAVHRALKEFSQEQLALVRKVAIDMIDTTLHNFLWMLEGHEGLELVTRTEDGTPVNLGELSDGLVGELYSEDGWIAKFSRYPPSTTP